ncbi:glycosyltransferase family 2 protein [Bacillus sp. V59.32b]|uniref:glycosyltransferase family 2 protein n=1 Tax=Bacillus sp. V59.32b TaxID=1758642 RepID=UPI000E3C2786|nr:glycosyltransferase family 2 protein [Bacillus sp. V59.32b]RFU64579.1 glycosyltransferase [Bacillus sp. V59.32b]
MVSIIMTSYNKPDTVGWAIQSVLDQSYDNWELYIMDDGSNQETKAAIQPFLSDSRIVYHNSHVAEEDRCKTTRYATLINEAIPMAKGAYLCYLTDDTIYLPDRLETMVNYLERNPDIDIVYSKQKVKHVNRFLHVISEYTRDTRGILCEAAKLVDHCSVMHRKTNAEIVYNKYGSYWDDHPDCWHDGDAAFWKRLNEFQCFHPIDKVLDISIKGPHSFQSLNAFLPETLPDGTLIKSTIGVTFLIDNQQRRKIDDATCRALKLNLQKRIDVHDPLLFKYNEGTAIDQEVFSNASLFPNLRLVRSKKKADTYYIQNNEKRLILNKAAFHRFKFSAIQQIFVPDSLLSQFRDGSPIASYLSTDMMLPDRILFIHGSAFYLSFNNCLHRIDRNVRCRLGFSIKRAVKIDDPLFSAFRQGEPFIWKRDKNK